MSDSLQNHPVFFALRRNCKWKISEMFHEDDLRSIHQLLKPTMTVHFHSLNGLEAVFPKDYFLFDEKENKIACANNTMQVKEFLYTTLGVEKRVALEDLGFFSVKLGGFKSKMFPVSCRSKKGKDFKSNEGRESKKRKIEPTPSSISTYLPLTFTNEASFPYFSDSNFNNMPNFQESQPVQMHMSQDLVEQVMQRIIPCISQALPGLIQQILDERKCGDSISPTDETKRTLGLDIDKSNVENEVANFHPDSISSVNQGTQVEMEDDYLFNEFESSNPFC